MNEVITQQWQEKQIAEFHKSCDAVVESYAKIMKENARLNKIITEWNSDAEIQKRDETIARMTRESFAYPSHAWPKVKAFMSDHYALGHSITHMFTETEITTVSECVCSCGKKLTFYN